MSRKIRDIGTFGTIKVFLRGFLPFTRPFTLSLPGGNVIFSGGNVIYSGGNVVFSGGNVIYSGGNVIYSGGHVIFSGGQIISMGGKIVSRVKDGVKQRFFPVNHWNVEPKGLIFMENGRYDLFQTTRSD
jgi:hypothetical protein